MIIFTVRKTINGNKIVLFFRLCHRISLKTRKNPVVIFVSRNIYHLGLVVLIPSGKHDAWNDFGQKLQLTNWPEDERQQKHLSSLLNTNPLINFFFFF